MEKKSEQITEDEKLTEKIVEFARRYHSEVFPNPDRKDCPPSETLRQAATSVGLPDEALRFHLLSCSPCYKDFQLLRNERVMPAVLPAVESPQKSEKRIWSDFFRRPLPVFALVLTAFTLLAIALYLTIRQSAVTEYAKKSLKEESFPQSSAGNKPEKEAIISDRAGESDPVPAETKAAKENTKLPAENQTSIANAVANKPPKTKRTGVTPEEKTVYLDLANAAVTRNPNAREKIHSLTAAPILLNVKLPVNSPAGVYKVFLLDEFGSALSETKTEKSSGKNIQTKLDLSLLKGRARLCIALKDEIPDCLPVEIGKAR